MSDSNLEIPESLRIKRDAVVSVELNEPLGFYPRSDYLLCEISGRIKIWETRKLIANYTKSQPDKPIAIRAVGRSMNTAVIMIHLMQTEEKLYSTFLNAQTFSVHNPNSNKPLTGIQFILFPK
ncbi:MAG: hypothetical protein ACXAC7_04365 [Candidatus Hodarchaeales archaeon]|jgi:hypothetical protein